jgi:hypothetical protein
MKISKASAGVLTVAALSLLAACGGGGGGGGVTPPGGGGGGGGVPTPTPTVAPTSTPTTGPTPTPPPSGTTVFAEENFINGSYAWYTSGTASWNNGAPGDSGDPSNAPNGAAVDGMACQSVTEGTSYPQSDFSQHVFLGIYFNGTWEAVPQGLGMVNPVAPIGTGNPAHTSNTQEIEENQCEYNIHTHDYSGLLHIEDESVPQSDTSFPAYANLQSFLDVSGATLSSTAFSIGSSTLAGPVSIYVGTPSTQVNKNDLVTSFTPYTGSASSLKFSKHMAIWLVIGTPPASLPNVEFVIVN